jgi:plastocyanin
VVKRAALAGLLLVVALPVAEARSSRDGTTHDVHTVANAYVPGDAQFADTPAQVIVQGDSLRHTNHDSESHDLLALENGPDGKPWFKSELIGQNETAPVPVEDLPPGVYGYTCSIHPFMRGRLDVRRRPSPPEPQGPGDVTVTADSLVFIPKHITVPTGTTVLWRNDGAQNHTVTANDGSWDSSPACPTTSECWRPGQTFAHTFNQTGTFGYYCKLHGTTQGTGHAGTVTVVPPGSTPTTTDVLSASASGGQVSVTGNATFQGEAPVTISEDAAGDPPAAAAGLGDETGVDMVKATAYRPNPDSASIFFEWHLTGLPDSGSLPEAVRYTIPFKIGTAQFQLQAKLSNVASVTVVDDPPGHPGHVGNAFQLRGNCLANWPQPQVPLANCPHLAWLGGSFDPATDVVRIKVPIGIRPEFAPGAALQRNVSTNTSLVRISATYQAVASSGTTTGDEAEWGTDDDTFTYRIPGKTVSLGIATAGTPQSGVSFGTAATVGASGDFTGSLSTAGLAPGSYDVWARSCFGTNCGARFTRITI